MITSTNMQMFMKEFCHFFSFYFRMIFYLKNNLKIFHVRANSYRFFSLAPKEEAKEKNLDFSLGGGKKSLSCFMTDPAPPL